MLICRELKQSTISGDHGQDCCKNDKVKSTLWKDERQAKDAAKEVYEFVTQEFKHENIADGALVVVCDKGVP